jgi:hypothetical protein
MIRNLINAVWDRWANLHPFVRFLLLVVVLGVLGMFAVKPAYRAFKAWRLERNLVAAKEAVESVRMDEARDLSLTVLRAGDPRIEAFRILEKATAKLRDPRHGDIARALMFHPEGSDEDRLNGFRGIAPEAPLGLLGQVWASLPGSCQEDARFATVFADRLLAERRFNEAASVLMGVPEKARSPEVSWRLVRVLIGTGRREGFEEAQKMITAGCVAGGSGVSGWLDVLEGIPAVSLQASLLGPVRERLADPAWNAELAPARRALLLARLDYAANFSGRGKVIDASVERWKNEDPVAVAKFLGDLGLYLRLLETFPAARVAEKPDLFLPVLEAMEKTGAWEQVAPLLDAHGTRLPKSEELGWRAVAAAKTGDGPQRVQLWNAAMGEAKSGPQATGYLTLNRLARRAGMTDEADEALVEAIRLGRGPLPLYADLKPLLQSLSQRGRENALLEICAIYLSFESGNPVLLTQYAYLACLNDLADPKLILKAMEALGKGFPNELPIQMVLATAYLCAGEPSKAAATLDPLKFDPEKIAPGYRAVFFTSQVLNGRMKKDDPRIVQFPWKSLQLSERKKLQGLIEQSGE